MLHAAESLRAEIVGDLIDRGADVAIGDRFGETALHRVADLRRTDGERAALVVGHAREVAGVLGEVDVGGVPVPPVALDEQAQRERVPVEPAPAQAGEA